MKSAWSEARELCKAMPLCRSGDNRHRTAGSIEALEQYRRTRLTTLQQIWEQAKAPAREPGWQYLCIKVVKAFRDWRWDERHSAWRWDRHSVNVPVIQPRAVTNLKFQIAGSCRYDAPPQIIYKYMWGHICTNPAQSHATLKIHFFIRENVSSMSLHPCTAVQAQFRRHNVCLFVVNLPLLP